MQPPAKPRPQCSLPVIPDVPSAPSGAPVGVLPLEQKGGWGLPESPPVLCLLFERVLSFQDPAAPPAWTVGLCCVFSLRGGAARSPVVTGGAAHHDPPCSGRI